MTTNLHIFTRNLKKKESFHLSRATFEKYVTLRGGEGRISVLWLAILRKKILHTKSVTGRGSWNSKHSVTYYSNAAQVKTIMKCTMLQDFKSYSDGLYFLKCFKFYSVSFLFYFCSSFFSLGLWTIENKILLRNFLLSNQKIRKTFRQPDTKSFLFFWSNV